MKFFLTNLMSVRHLMSEVRSLFLILIRNHCNCPPMYLLISGGSISNLVMCLGLTRVACCSRSKMISRNRMEAGAILLRMRHGAGHINDIAAILIQYHYCSLHSPFHIIL